MGSLRTLAAWACALALTPAWADTGAVSQLSGTLSVKKPDGTVRILSKQSEIRAGDTLSTEHDSYAQIRFSDGGQITLKPNTAVRLDQFRLAQDKPQEDAFAPPATFIQSLLSGRQAAGIGEKLECAISAR